MRNATIVADVTIQGSMPKEESTSESTPKKTAIRKRRATTRTTKTTTKKTASTTASSTTRSRKAPTTVPKTEKPSNNRIKFLVAGIVALLAIGGTSYAIGVSDQGQINVASTISDRVVERLENAESTETEALEAINAQKQTRPKAKNGGLVGRGNKVTEQQKKTTVATPDTTSSSTASTTDDVAATTTEETTEVSEEGLDEASTGETASTTQSEP